MKTLTIRHIGIKIQQCYSALQNSFPFPLVPFPLQKGFTIIELVVYMGIFSILIGILTSVFASLLNNQLTSDSSSSLDENGKYILSRLEYDINRAQSILVPGNPGNQTNNLQLKINNITYLYSLDANGNFTITDITDSLGPYNLNDYDATVSGILFKRIGSIGGKNTIQAGYTIFSTSVAKGATQSAYFQTTIGTR